MSELKEIVVPESNSCNSGMFSLLSALLSQKGVDPNVLLAMRNKDGFCGDSVVWVLFLLILFGRNGFNGSEGNLSNLINNDSGRELLMQAINGNNTAISQLASTLNCSINSIQAALGNLSSQIQNVGNSIGMSTQQVINAILSGNATIASQLCSVNNNITTMGYQNQLANQHQTYQLTDSINNVGTRMERGFCETAYATQAQTCAIQNSIKDSMASIIDGQRQAELRDMQEKINCLQEKNSQQAMQINNGQQSALFAQMLQQAIAPISTALCNITTEISTIKASMPPTYPVQYQPFVPVPNAVAYQYGIAPQGGFWN